MSCRPTTGNSNIIFNPSLRPLFFKIMDLPLININANAYHLNSLPSITQWLKCEEAARPLIRFSVIAASGHTSTFQVLLFFESFFLKNKNEGFFWAVPADSRVGIRCGDKNDRNSGAERYTLVHTTHVTLDT